MSSTRHIVIVGGGVIGLSAAFYCARRGFRVTLVERNGASRDGCSFGNAGMICPSHFVPLAAPGMVALGLRWMWNPKSPFYIRPRLNAGLLSWGIKFWQAATARRVERASPVLRDLNLASRSEFVEISALPDTSFGLTKKGLIMLCREQRAMDEEARFAERARQLGLPAEILDASQVASLEPGLRMDVLGGVYFPKDAHLVPDRFLAALECHASKAGAQFCWDTEVVDWRLKDDRVVAVRTARGDELAGDEFVLGAGCWSPSLAGRLGLRLPMQAGKGYSLTLPNPRQLPQICAILTEARVAVTPMGKALRFGGTMEIGGLDEEIRPARIQGIIEAVLRYFPDFQMSDFAQVSPWSGLRPVSPDGLPYLGRSRKWRNLVVATGHAMLGLSLGPISGKLVAQLVADEKPQVDLQLLSPDRYG